MKTVEIPILPTKQQFIGSPQILDLKALCVFAATGFFMGDDTYWQEQKVLLPGKRYNINGNKIVSEDTYFQWYYNPIERPLSQIVEEFTSLFETIINEQVCQQKVILPLSGGLDSRTQAAALHHLKKDVQSYSYELAHGHPDTSYSEQIAKACGFPFQKMVIPEGYLWDKIDQIAAINGCYTEFTHPRQVAVMDQLINMGDVISLGHWGDVLFDDMKVAENLSFDGQVAELFDKVLKKQGIPFAEALWKKWDLEGNFVPYLKDRISEGLRTINIPNNANAQIRAFKSLYWAPRWTAVNLSFFESVKPITLPYFDNRMCEFICTVPERYLAGRQIQIEYLKFRNPALAKITWQEHRPCNLYTYSWNKTPWNLPFRVYQKLKNTVFTQKLVKNNYENQFLGARNDIYLKRYLFESKNLKELVDFEMIEEVYSQFKFNSHLQYSHCICTLLTLAVKFRDISK
jgi:hypothetical protein